MGVVYLSLSESKYNLVAFMIMDKSKDQVERAGITLNHKSQITITSVRIQDHCKL